MRASRASSAFLRTGLAIAAVFGWLAATAWFRPLMEPDEGRYVGVAFEMLRSGDWWVPRLDGLPFFHKPPLFYWISAAAMSALGAFEWPARLPSIIGATFAAAGLLLFLRRWADAASATLSAVVLVTMPFFHAAAQFANLDMLVAGCISATVLLAAHATLSKEQGAAWRWALAGSFFFAALAVLSKGLIGLVLPSAIFLIWCGATARFRAAWLLAWPPGWGIVLVIAGPWFVAMQMRYPGFFDYFVVTQHFRRFAHVGFNNEQAVWFYLPVIAGLTLPWFAWLALSRWRGRPFGPKLSDVDWLMCIWCVTVVVFFSVPRSKLVGYVLPALPPLAYLIARVALTAVDGSGRLGRPVRWTIVLAALLCAMGAALLGTLLPQPGARLRLPADQTIEPGDQVLMFDAYYYGLAFHWGLKEPVLVVADWSPTAVGQRDDWRKELHDAGKFEPERGLALLIDVARMRDALCVPRPTWVIAHPDARRFNAWLAHASLVASDGQAAVWRFSGSPTRDGRCLETPTDGLPQKSTPP